MFGTQSQFLEYFPLATSGAVWVDILLNFIVAIIYGFFVSMIYRQCRGMHANRTFIHTLYMLTLIITLIMMVILSVRGTAAVAVAFGLMGALSIIRFRTVVKDNRDTAFVFLAVGVGMAAGTGQWWIGFIGIAVVGITLLLLSNTPWGNHKNSVIIKITFRPDAENTPQEETTPQRIMQTLAHLGTQQQMMHVRTIRLGEQMEATYSLVAYSHVEPGNIVQELLGVKGVDSVNIFNPEELQEP